MSQYLIDCRGINLILSILKENTFREIALQVIFIITTALLKQMFKVLLSVNPRQQIIRQIYKLYLLQSLILFKLTGTCVNNGKCAQYSRVDFSRRKFQLAALRHDIHFVANQLNSFYGGDLSCLYICEWHAVAHNCVILF